MFDVLKIENTEILLSFRMLSKPYCCLIQEGDLPFPKDEKYICLVQDERRKIFVIYYDQFIFDKFKEHYRQLSNNEKFYKTIFIFDLKNINFKFDSKIEIQSTDLPDLIISKFMDQFLDQKTKFLNETKFYSYIEKHNYV